MRYQRYPPLVGAALVLGACDVANTGDLVCPDYFEFGLHITVQDSLTGLPAASGAQLIVQHGSYADTVNVPANRPDLNAHPLPSAGERAGTYTVSVHKAGFVDWVRTGIVVAADKCHVR